LSPKILAGLPLLPRVRALSAQICWCTEKMQAQPQHEGEDAENSEDAAELDTAGQAEAGTRPLHVVAGSGIAAHSKNSEIVKTKLALGQAQWLASRQALVIGLAAELLDARDIDHAASNFVNVLHQKFLCSRVVLGMADGTSGDLRLAAISQQAVVDTSSAEARLLLEVLDESIEFESSLSWPAASDSLAVVDAHDRLSAGRKDVQIHTVPLFHETEVVGAVMLERKSDKALASKTCELLEQAAAVATPILHLHRSASRSIRSQCKVKFRRFAEKLIGPEYLAAKCLAAAALLATVMLALIPVDATVVAEAEVVARERRIVSAPTNGFIDSISARAGDRVVEGQLLLTLDTRDLVLQADRYDNEIQSAEAEFRASMAAHDRKAMAVAQADLSRARAERDLVYRQIERASVRSSIDGFVVNDVLNQAVGSPVARGDVLLELAPEAGNEIHVLVHEHDIPDVTLDLQGELALRANPGDALAFTVTRIHPVAETGDGQNLFRITASLEAEPTSLRPGQTGIARLSVGSDSALSVTTHRFTRWFKQQWWEWFG